MQAETLKISANAIDPQDEMATMKFLVGKCVGVALGKIMKDFQALKILQREIANLEKLINEQSVDSQEKTDQIAVLAERQKFYANERTALASYVIAAKQNPLELNCSAGPTNQDVPMTVVGFDWFQELLRKYHIRQQPEQILTIKQITDGLSMEPGFLADIQDHFALAKTKRKNPTGRGYIKPVEEATKVLTEYLTKIGSEELANAQIKIR